MDDDPQKLLPLVYVPLAPVVTPMIAAWCVLFDASIIAAHVLTDGRYPSLAKVIVCTMITILANVYRAYTARQHKACRRAFADIVKEGLGRPAITINQAAMVVVTVLAVSALFAWVFIHADQ